MPKTEDVKKYEAERLFRKKDGDSTEIKVKGITTFNCGECHRRVSLPFSVYDKTGGLCMLCYFSDPEEVFHPKKHTGWLDKPVSLRMAVSLLTSYYIAILLLILILKGVL